MVAGRTLTDVELARCAGIPLRRFSYYTEPEIVDDAGELDVWVWPYAARVALAIGLAKITGRPRLIAVIG